MASTLQPRGGLQEQGSLYHSIDVTSELGKTKEKITEADQVKQNMLMNGKGSSDSAGQSNDNGKDYLTHEDISSMGNLPYLQGLRALATIIIQIGHIIETTVPGSRFFTSAALTSHFIQGGLLITGTLLRQQSATANRSWSVRHRHLPRFFVNRWIRLYPALIAMLVVIGYWWLSYFHDLPHLLKNVARSLFKLQHTSILYPGEYPPNPFAHTWFLDVQEHFYLVWALALPFITVLRTKLRIVVLLCIFFYSFHLRLKEDRFNATLSLNMFKLMTGASIQLIPIPRSWTGRNSSFIAGAILLAGILWGFNPWMHAHFAIGAQRLQGDIFALVAIPAFALASFSTKLAQPSPSASLLASHPARLSPPSLCNTLVQRFLLFILDSPQLKFVARISYSWYLWQVPLLLCEQSFQTGPRAVSTTAEAFILALISTFCLEEPIRDAYLRRRKRLTTSSRS